MVKGHFNEFLRSFDISTEGSNGIAESHAFEMFVNYLVLSSDDPTVFSGETSLLDDISIGGNGDLWLDGLAIRINGRIVTEKEDIEEIRKANGGLEIDFIFIQSKKTEAFDKEVLIALTKGVEYFLKNSDLTVNNAIKHYMDVKDECLATNNNNVWNRNPNIYIYYATSGDKSKYPMCKEIVAEEERAFRAQERFPYVNDVQIRLIDANDLTAMSRELEGRYETIISANDIISLDVDESSKVKKAFTFTCYAKEFLKILQKQDGNLRRTLFNDNVRDFLGNSSSVNQEIEESIITQPEMFLFCNNGVTIVSSEFEHKKNKDYRIVNPQIVNGCQTSNTIYNLRENPNIDKVQISVRVICTDDPNISNVIVRGTNKQNQVLDEAFECTRTFHKNLEEFFKFRNDAEKIYYERRNKQYSNDTKIKKTQIANLRVLTQSYVATFKAAPYKAHCHEANLLEQYTKDSRMIYRDEDELITYYLSVYIWYKIEQVFRENRNRINKRYGKFKGFLYYICFKSFAKHAPTRQNKIVPFCEEMIKFLDSSNFTSHFFEYIEIFDEAVTTWKKAGRSIHTVKENPAFLETLNTVISKKYYGGEVIDTVKDEVYRFKGTLLNFYQERNNNWYAFIGRPRPYKNVYFNQSSFLGKVRHLLPKVKLIYELPNKNSATASRVWIEGEEPDDVK